MLLKLLWVDTRMAGARDAGAAALVCACEVREIDSSALGSREADGDWDVVCVDLDFPDVAGLKLIARIRRRWPAVPLVMLVMRNSADLAVWALRAGVFDVLTKPVEAEDAARVLRRVRRMCQGGHVRSGDQTADSLVMHLPAEAFFKPQPSVDTRLRGAVHYISRHFSRPLPESEIALACRMSPARFCREFKATYGITFLEYLSNRRISEAKRLLENHSMPIADVAAAVGFSDSSYFTRVFRRQEGRSPSEYRATGLVHYDLGPGQRSASSASRPQARVPAGRRISG